MTRTTFRKTLSANDLGLTGGHQGGVLIPKGETALLNLLPPLKVDVKNPDAWITCIDANGDSHRFRFVYYNNKLHDERGTRNEYRITYMTAWFRNQCAQPGDAFEISREHDHPQYRIRIVRAEQDPERSPDDGPVRIRLRGWRRVH